ncbi:MAG: M56 family metallopeptidase [Clostridiaceae bacterium]|nr:M56 family metallopeptidase [Clostridiaceae bacterium]
MTNIWGFLVQTITVSLVAALLLLVKELLADKLSPRWQYSIWGVLALRILLPVSIARNVLLPVPLWVETWKGAAERTLDSAYTAIYAATSVRWPFPILEGRPQSITDWLFVLYATGMLVMLLWYLASYLRLRLILHRGSLVLEATQARIQSVCDAYSLRSCRAVAVAGLTSAFVCGVLRPTLALPADAETDDKVLLHELLHLKYHDALQSVIWCIFRALHWCNPFLQFVFNRIGNDMESLCDQRVLEKLEGEERRKYGGILLSMANDRYPRAPGTTSVSNGGKNIARRITAIVRFKKYPRGMGLVSICIAFVLAFPALAGTAAGYQSNYYRPDAGWEFERAMALARIQRCNTVAGALDTYVKGLMYENGIYTAMASPLGQHEKLEAEMRQNAEVDGWVAYHLDAGDELEYLSQNDGYYICNLDKQEDGSYTAMLVFQVTALLNPDGEGWMSDENGDAYGASTVVVPITVRNEGGWVVEEREQRLVYPETHANEIAYSDGQHLCLMSVKQQGKSGTVSIGVQTVYTVDNAVSLHSWSVFSDVGFDETVKPSAKFDRVDKNVFYEYRFHGTKEQRNALSHVAMELVELSAPDEKPEFPNKDVTGVTSWGDSNGNSGDSRLVTPGWGGTLSGGGGGGVDINDGLAVLPVGYAVRIYWDGEPVEDFILGEAD